MQHFACIFLVNRIVAVNARFGHAAGDHILLRFSQNVAQRLSPGDAFFRWYGPAFLVILNRSVPHDAVRAEVARVASGHKEEEIQVGTRTILLSISSNTSVLDLREYSQFDDVLQKLNALPGIPAA
jgi:diguanylate cyclase (GGDEF)-like protein